MTWLDANEISIESITYYVTDCISVMMGKKKCYLKLMKDGNP